MICKSNTRATAAIDSIVNVSFCAHLAVLGIVTAMTDITLITILTCPPCQLNSGYYTFQKHSLARVGHFTFVPMLVIVRFEVSCELGKHLNRVGRNQMSRNNHNRQELHKTVRFR
eukprot:1223552-Amphidinium_carterae.1